MADVFDEEVPRSWRDELFELVAKTPHLYWLILTKRPQNIAGLLTDPLPDNVWLGTSIEDQKRANERVPVVLSIPAQVHFLSAEPLLGPVIVPDIAEIDLVIVGAESLGSWAGREMKLGWALSLRKQAAKANVSFFMKQMAINGRITGDISRFPKDLPGKKLSTVILKILRVRQYPR